MSVVPVRRALVSVSDKTGLVPFVQRLVAVGVEIVSSGGTARALEEAGVPVRSVEDVTGSPEMLGGRVKTLHPKIHGGILADLGSSDHEADLAAHGIETFQLVVSNLYPFRQTAAAADATRADIVEQIDIGGPAMVRAAAKNHAWVGIVTSPAQYDEVAGAVEPAVSRRICGPDWHARRSSIRPPTTRPSSIGWSPTVICRSVRCWLSNGLRLFVTARTHTSEQPDTGRLRVLPGGIR
jgi:hypothetical protein